MSGRSIVAGMLGWCFATGLLQAQAPGPVAYWSFDEGAGKVLVDSSGHQNTGTVHGNPTSTAGRLGQCLQLAGRDQIEIPDGAWNCGVPLTILFWYKTDPSAQAGALLYHRYGPAGGFQFMAGNYGPACGALLFWDRAQTNCTFGMQGTLGKWNFVAITITDTEVNLYQDGELLAGMPKRIQGFPKLGGSLVIRGAQIGQEDEPGFRGCLDELAIYHRVLGAAEIKSIYQNFSQGTGLLPAAQLRVVSVTTDKRLYRPGETGHAEVIVKNFTDTAREIRLAASVVSLLEQEHPLEPIRVSVPAMGCATVPIPFSPGDADYGCELRVQVEGGERDDVAGRRYFAVAENFWKVGLGGLVNNRTLAGKSNATIAEELKELSVNYANWAEYFFWAPDDWGGLTPTNEWWYAGQGGAFQRRDRIQEMIRQAHALDIKMVTYGKGIGGGAAGWELARRRPDWFSPADCAQPGDPPDRYTLDNWDNPDKAVRTNQAFQAEGWIVTMPNLHKLEPLEYGIDEIGRSATAFGWDGIRFDGHYTVDNLEVSADNMRRLKERVWKIHPQFRFGFNYGFAPPTSSGLDHEMREGLAGGGAWVQEAIGNYGYSAGGGAYTNWQFYAANELRVAKLIQSAGGTYHCIWALGSKPQDIYKLVYGLIAGGHPMYGTYWEPPVCDNWGKFLTRWSAFLWQQNLRQLAQPEKIVSVAAPAPVEWQPFAQEFVASPTRKFLVLHLVNPSPHDAIAHTSLPAPVENIEVRLRPEKGTTVRRVKLVQPDAGPELAYDRELPLTRQQDSIRVTVPRLAVWALVIVEVEGRFTVPPIGPRFTEPPDPAQVAAGRKSSATSLPSLDPLKPEAATPLAPNEVLFETDEGSQNIAPTSTVDPEAFNRKAQVRERGQGAGGAGRSWMGPLLPGRYSFRLRAKFEDPKPVPSQQIMAVSLVVNGISPTLQLATWYFNSVRKTNNTGVVIVDNRYHDYELPEFEVRELCFVQLGVTFQSPADPQDNRALLDHVILKKLEVYTDQQLAQWDQSAGKPAGLRAPAGAHPQRILLVRGLWWQSYGIEKAVTCTNSYALPSSYEELYAHDAVVLANQNFATTSYAVRRMFKDYVTDGGRLVILGGSSTLGSGGFAGTCLDELLPFDVKSSCEVVRCQPPRTLGPQPGTSFGDRPALFWRHALTLRTGSDAFAFAGAQPVAARRRVGNGQVVVFAGTVLGEGGPDAKPFWECPSWKDLAKRMIVGAD